MVDVWDKSKNLLSFQYGFDGIPSPYPKDDFVCIDRIYEYFFYCISFYRYWTSLLVYQI